MDSVPLDIDMNSGMGPFLTQDELIDPVALSEAKVYCRAHHLALAHYLVQSQIMSGIQLLQCCMRHCDLSVFDLNQFDATILQAKLLPVEWMQRFRMIPVRRYHHVLQLAVVDPTCFSVISKVRFHTGLHIELILVNEEALESLFVTLFSKRVSASLALLVHEMTPAIAVERIIDQTHSDDEEPVTQFVSQLLSDGETHRASDIHCEPCQDHYRIRFRVDGQLQNIVTIPINLALRVLARIKVLANLDVAEKRLPQDGRINAQHANYPEMRVSTCPTVLGEKIVLRLFRRHCSILALDQLGLFNEQLLEVMRAIKKPYGLILVAGPTGCGKTVTLYAIMHALKDAAMNIITIEEPVEMVIAGVNQMNVNLRAGLGFATLLRAVLRQDPDVIMVGEIRDAETAMIALQAASTGHLVLGTLHANHSLAAIHRLTLLGISLQDGLQSVVMVIAQRLVRQLCPHCKEKATNLLPQTTGVLMEQDTLYQVRRCADCHDGYQGRTAVFEVLLPDQQLISLLMRNTPLSKIEATLAEKGWLSLYRAGLRKALLGETTVDEVQRVIGHA